MSNKFIDIDRLLIDLQQLDYYDSRNQLIDWLNKDRKSPKIGIFYLESSSEQEITWHFSCLIKEISGSYNNPKVEKLENTKTFLQVLCNKEIETHSSHQYEDIYQEWTSGLKPILIPVEHRSCPPNLPWETIVKELVSLHQDHPGVPFMFYFLGKKCPPGFTNNVKTAFENMKAAIAATSEFDRFYVSKFGEPSQPIVNGVSNRGIYDCRSWGYDEGRRSHLAKIIQVNPTLISTVLDGMNPDQYSQKTGYQVWTDFFEMLDKTTFWEDIQADNLPCRIELQPR